MQDSIKENREFRRVYRRGKCSVAQAVVTYSLESRIGKIRVGITSGKKIGGAVTRNRARRVIRAAFRMCKPYLKPNASADLVFVARTATAKCKSTELADVILRQLTQAGLAEEPI